MLSSTQPQSRTNGQECNRLKNAGAPWRILNVGQREKRRSMVQLYGIKKQLLTRGAVMQTAEFVPLLLIQVSTEQRKCLDS